MITTNCHWLAGFPEVEKLLVGSDLPQLDYTHMPEVDVNWEAAERGNVIPHCGTNIDIHDRGSTPKFESCVTR